LSLHAPAAADDPAAPPRPQASASAPVAALPSRPVASSFPVRRPDPGARSSGGSSWWFGPIGVTLVLVGAVAAGWAARRGGLVPPPHRETGPEPRVIGRAALTPRQAVYTVRVGDRILLVGTGPNAAPSLLGDWIEPPAAPPEPLVPVATATRPPATTLTAGRLTRTTSGEAS
jgi:flagellar biogenesis protein FliO